MKIYNAYYLQDGRIACEYEHEVYGKIPSVVSPDDEPTRLIWQYIVDNNLVISYEDWFNANKDEIERQERLQQIQRELQSISSWLASNDWKINKITIGEWKTTDSRWVEYLNERKIKRARQDELNLELTNLKGEMN